MVANRDLRAVFVRKQNAELLFPREELHVEKITN